MFVVLPFSCTQVTKYLAVLPVRWRIRTFVGSLSIFLLLFGIRDVEMQDMNNGPEHLPPPFSLSTGYSKLAIVMNLPAWSALLTHPFRVITIAVQSGRLATLQEHSAAVPTAHIQGFAPCSCVTWVPTGVSHLD